MQDQAKMLEFLNRLKAFWQHGGDSRQPHVLGTSGRHLDAYVNCTPLVENPAVLEPFCRDLTEILAKRHSSMVCNGRVVGPAHGASFLAYEMARTLSLWTNFIWYAGFTEPQPDKSMLMKRFDVVRQNAFIVEDVVTTGGSTAKVIDEVERAGGIVLPVIGVLFNRSGLTHIGDRPIVALIDLPLPSYTPEECPLCAAGSEAISAKGNWDLLNGGWENAV